MLSGHPHLLRMQWQARSDGSAATSAGGGLGHGDPARAHEVKPLALAEKKNKGIMVLLWDFYGILMGETNKFEALNVMFNHSMVSCLNIHCVILTI